MNALSDAEYVRIGGVRCPHCRSEDIEGGQFEVEAGDVWQPVWCRACGQKWEDIYKLAGWESAE